MQKEINLADFPSVSKGEWKGLAKKQLKGVDPASLIWQVDQGISVEPYYDSSDLEGLEYLIDFFSKVAPFRWKLYEEIQVSDETNANHSALEALQGGCDGVILDIKDQINPQALLQGVLLDICDICVKDPSNRSLEDLKCTQDGFHLGENGNTYAMKVCTSRIDEIVDLLLGLGSESHITREASPDFFLEIATIRAIRFLLFDRFGKNSWSIKIHSSVSAHAMVDHQWFLNSTAGLASILGGTSSISFTTAEGSSRISRNVGNLIREESGITMYEDQCGGSYYVEKLTHMIIEACKTKLNRR